MPLKVLVSDTVMNLKKYFTEKKVVIERAESLKKASDVAVDQDYIREVLKNIMENAVKFNAKAEKKITFSAHESDDSIYLDIEDNGPGIPHEEHEKIFSKFYISS